MNTFRFQAELSSDQLNSLKKLMELGDMPTNRDLMNNALSLFKWAAKMKSEGWSVCAVNKDSHVIRELEMPVLDAIAAKSSHRENVSTDAS